MTTNPATTASGERPRTLSEVIADLECLAIEAEAYPTDQHGFPGKHVADAWTERKSESLQWAKAVAERVDSAMADKISWQRTSANRFPSTDWELQRKHLRRVISELHQWLDEQAVLGPAPIRVPAAQEPQVVPGPAEPLVTEQPHAQSRSWMERHGWQALGALIASASLIVAVMAALRWGPFE